MLPKKSTTEAHWANLQTQVVKQIFKTPALFEIFNEIFKLLHILPQHMRKHLFAFQLLLYAGIGQCDAVLHQRASPWCSRNSIRITNTF